jgi:hypothetical protein
VVGYVIVFGVALVSRLLLVAMPIPYVTAVQRAAWSWRFFAVFVLCFLCAMALASRSNLPTPAETLSRPRALAIACAVGSAVALLTIWSDILAPAAQARGLATIHVTGWVAVPFYAYGAILLTTVFHFLPIAFAAWLAQKVRGRLRLIVLGIAVAAVGISEDAGYFLRNDLRVDVDAGRHVLSMLGNSSEALLIYRFGFLAGLAQRSTTYLLWHLIWPLFRHS